MADSNAQEILRSADRMQKGTSLARHREIPENESAWVRAGDLVRIKLADIELGLPENLPATAVGR